MNSNDFIILDGNSLTIEQVNNAVYKNKKIRLSDEAASRIKQAHETVRSIGNSENTVYGVNTGFGALSSVSISPDKVKKLQENIVKSHASGSGESFPVPKP